ncbi:hypothetical protein [Natronorubrum sp. A-ect3]
MIWRCVDEYSTEDDTKQDERQDGPIQSRQPSKEKAAVTVAVRYGG